MVDWLPDGVEENWDESDVWEEDDDEDAAWEEEEEQKVRCQRNIVQGEIIVG